MRYPKLIPVLISLFFFCGQGQFVDAAADDNLQVTSIEPESEVVSEQSVAPEAAVSTASKSVNIDAITPGQMTAPVDTATVDQLPSTSIESEVVSEPSIEPETAASEPENIDNVVSDQVDASEDEPEQYYGLIEPDKLIAVSSPIPGVLDKVKFDKGDWVRKGQIIASLKSGVERASVDLAKAKHSYNKRRLERNRELFEKKLIPQMEFDDIETETLLAWMELRQAEEQLEQRIIRSPVSGIVVERKYSSGEFVQEHEILKIAKLNPLKVEVILPVEMFGKVKKGLKAKVYIFGYDEPFSGRISLVDPIIDAASDTFAVRIKLPNKKNRLPAGLKCKVSFIE